MITLTLDNVGYGTADVPMPPEKPGDPTRVGKLLQFADEQSGIVVNVPLRPDVAADLAAMLTDKKVVAANATALDAVKAQIPEPGKPKR